jgi:predicted phage terminase large subunit-like protein
MTNPYQQAAAIELLRRAEALESIEKFAAFMAPVNTLEFGWSPAPHHKVIIDHLEALERGDIRRLLIMAPPGSAKSTYCSIQFPLWYLAKHPDHFLLCCSNTEDLAKNFNGRRRNGALSPEWIQLADSKLDEKRQGIELFATVNGGTVMAAGVGSAITGRRSHLNILDDPVRGFEEALSMTQLDKIWQWYEYDFRTRLMPQIGKELVITTRWSKRDVAGRILDLANDGREEWTIVRLPMLCDDPLRDPLQRKTGEPLWPSWFDGQLIEQNQRDPRRWSAMYQQVPLDESGQWIDEDCIQYVEKLPNDLRFVIGVDLALTVGRGDYTVLAVLGLDGEHNVYLVEVARDRITPDETAKRLFALCKTYKPTDVLIDDDNASKVFRRLVAQLAREHAAHHVNLWPLPTRGQDKETRAAAIRGWFLQKRVFIKRGPWNADVHRELLSFPAGDHDDVVDALSLVGRRLDYLVTPSVESVATRDKRENWLYTGERDEHGRYITRATLEQLWEDHKPPPSRRIN